MMASTMSINQVALPNFHCPMQAPMHGTNPGNIQGAIPGTYPCHVPVPGRLVSGPVINGNSPPAAAISPPIQTLRVPVVPVGGGCYNDGMEVVWHGEFSRLFSSFCPPHLWFLSITNSAPQEKWKFYRDSAKVRFCCRDCGNGWTSMKGRVTFWFYLNAATGNGFVQFKLYGQVCKKCNSGKFEYVMWYPEEVSKVMSNVYNKVGQTFYGFMQPPIRIDRRPGRPRNQHNAELCQACRDGECDQGRPVKPLYNFIPPAINQRAPNQPMPGGMQMCPMGPPSQMPVVIRQPPIPHPGHIVMQGQVNSTPSQMAGHMVQVSQSGHTFITAPVTLTSGIQPILTYSIVTGPVKDPSKLTPVITEDKSIDWPTPTEITNGHTSPPQDLQKATVNTSIAMTTSEFNTAVDAKVTKPVTVSIQTPMVNGILHGTAKNVQQSAEEKSPVVAKNISSTISTVTSSLSQMKVTPNKQDDLGPVTNGVHDKEEKKITKVPIINGYAAAAAGKPVPVNGTIVNGKN